jgi:hypothetical protein
MLGRKLTNISSKATLLAAAWPMFTWLKMWPGNALWP